MGRAATSFRGLALLAMNDFFDSRVRTDDAADTHAWLQAQYGHVDVLADRVSIAEHAVGDAAFALRRLAWDCRAEIVYEADRFFFATSGPGYAWRIGARHGDYSVEPGIVEPGHELIGSADRTEVQLLTFDADWLREAARTMYGDDALEVRFGDRSRLAAAAGLLAGDSALVAHADTPARRAARARPRASCARRGDARGVPPSR